MATSPIRKVSKLNFFDILINVYKTKILQNNCINTINILKYNNLLIKFLDERRKDGNTGHDGSLSTGHGNNPADMLKRLETMVLTGTEIPLMAVRGQIASAIDIMVHLSRFRDGSRKVVSIMEVTGFTDGEITLEPLYRYEEETGDGDAAEGVRGKLKATGRTLGNREKLRHAGITQV